MPFSQRQAMFKQSGNALRMIMKTSFGSLKLLLRPSQVKTFSANFNVKWMSPSSVFGKNTRTNWHKKRLQSTMSVGKITKKSHDCRQKSDPLETSCSFTKWGKLINHDTIHMSRPKSNPWRKTGKWWTEIAAGIIDSDYCTIMITNFSSAINFLVHIINQFLKLLSAFDG